MVLKSHCVSDRCYVTESPHILIYTCSGTVTRSLAAKFSVNNLTHRDKTVCSNHQLLKEEEYHLKQALWKCPVYAINMSSIKSNRSNKGSNNIRNNPTTNINKPHIVVPYIKGVSESCKNNCIKHGIQMYFKGGRTIKDLLVKPKDTDTIWQKNGVINRYKCGRVD